MPEPPLHLEDLRRLHKAATARREAAAGGTTDPREGFATMGLCAGCVVDMAHDILHTAATEIGVQTPSGPEAIPIAMQIYSYGIMMGQELAREGRA